MKKYYKKTTLFVVVFLIAISEILIINNASNKKENLTSSNYYNSFVSSVNSLDLVLAQIDEKNIKDDTAVLMFDAYTSIVFINHRMDLMLDHSAIKLNTLSNDFLLLENSYASLVRDQISDETKFNSQEHKLFKQQIHQFLNDLPKEYEDSDNFINQLNEAGEQIKPLIH
ncbi:hypothetical protein [Paenibacillus sp. ALJ109b]|uniref:hypothetical protein n=1 Tax=Paenibacillus sp. ALJ109b TaxID=2709068 RepID=UPI0013CF9850|nr:hypothetical protein [Paenibacillus sp. ALJ109b]NEU59999.1 hypothetical protein [Paenibacillus sp. ALJ109b]